VLAPLPFESGSNPVLLCASSSKDSPSYKSCLQTIIKQNLQFERIMVPKRKKVSNLMEQIISNIDHVLERFKRNLSRLEGLKVPMLPQDKTHRI
jgi:hypothetical protein